MKSFSFLLLFKLTFATQNRPSESSCSDDENVPPFVAAGGDFQSARELLAEVPHGIITGADMRQYLAPCTAMPLRDTAQYAILPGDLASKFLTGEGIEFNRETFINPVLMEHAMYTEFWAGILEKSAVSFPAAILDLWSEYRSFAMTVAEYTDIFYSRLGGHQLRKQDVDVLLMHIHFIDKIIDTAFTRILAPCPKAFFHLMYYANVMMKVACYCMANPIELKLSRTLERELSKFNNSRSWSDMQKVIQIGERLAKQVSKPALVEHRGRQFSVIVEVSLKLGVGILKVLAKHMENEVNLNDFTHVEETFEDRHYLDFMTYLVNLNTTRNGCPPLKVSDMREIIDRTSPDSYMALYQGNVPDCPYFCDFVLKSPVLKGEDEMKDHLRGVLEAEDKKRMASLEKLLDAEAEVTLKRKETVTVVGPTKSSSKGKGKGKGKAAAGKRKHKDTADQKKNTAGRLDASQLLNQNLDSNTVASKTQTTSATAAKSPSTPAPVDEREKAFATIVIGEYILKSILYPAIKLLGLNPEHYLWEDVEAAIMSQIKGRFAPRRLFLLKCIEWVKRRNAIAHPEDLPSGTIGQLWYDLELLQKELGQNATNQIRSLLTLERVPRLKSSPAALSTFGRAELGITAANIKRTLAAIRLCEFILTRKLVPLSKEHGITLKLSHLEQWEIYLPFLKGIVSAEFICAAAILLRMRSGLAHPSGTAQMVRVLVQNVLYDEAEFDTFLSYLASRQN